MKRKAKIHWIIFIIPIVILAISGFLYFQGNDYQIFSIILMFISILIFLNRVWYIISNSLSIDSSFVTLKKGVFSTVKDRIPVEKIENFRVIKSLMGNILNYGTIKYGNDSSYPIFKYVSDPDSFLTSYKKSDTSFKKNEELNQKSKVNQVHDSETINAIQQPSNLFYENEESKEHKRKEEKVEILGHTYIKNSDGTIEQPSEKLMWIGAPLGCKWSFGRFQGQPIKISWNDATKKYGKGTKVVWFSGCNQNVYKEDFNKEYGYQKGKEKVVFSSYSDWRLPTLNELRTLFNPFAEISRSDKIYHLEEEKNIDGKEISYAEFKRLYEKLFPFFYDGCRIWSANYSSEAGSFSKIIKGISDDKHIANGWSYHPRSWLYNDHESHFGNFIVFVRNNN